MSQIFLLKLWLQIFQPRIKLIFREKIYKSDDIGTNVSWSWYKKDNRQAVTTKKFGAGKGSKKEVWVGLGWLLSSATTKKKVRLGWVVWSWDRRLRSGLAYAMAGNLPSCDFGPTRGQPQTHVIKLCDWSIYLCYCSSNYISIALEIMHACMYM